MRKYTASFVLVVLLSMPCLVFASDAGVETVNDLFRLYNEALLEEQVKAEEEYQDAKARLDKQQNEIINDEIHNEIIKEAESWRNKRLQKIDTEISMLFEDNNLLAQEIDSKFLGSWEELLRLSKSYKMNINKINELLDSKSEYSVTETRVIDYATLDALSQEVKELLDTYKEAVDVKILGRVNGVKYPLSSPTVMTSGYGNRVDPITGAGISFHAGIDLRASVGTEVLSLFNGVIINSGYSSVAGYYVNVDHGNGVRTFYCHLSKILCNIGDKVNQYDVIALSGNTGSRTTGPHLHMGLYINGNSVNPEILFNRK